MIIGKILGCDKGNTHHFAIWNSGMHIGPIVEISRGRINQHKRCYNPSGVNEYSFIDADLSTHIVTKIFMGVN